MYTLVIHPALNWEWRFRIGSEGLEFGVMFSNLQDVFKFGVEVWNWEWRFQIRSDVFELEVMFSNLE